MEREDDIKFKLVLFGDGGVGKTSITYRYIKRLFKADLKLTIGVEFSTKTLEIDGLKVSLFIWDFAGEKRFRTLFPNYATGASGGIFMYDVTRFASINNIDGWVPLFRQYTYEDVPIIMIGNKVDLEDERVVQKETALEISEKNNLVDYFECSAKSGENVDKIFEVIAREMVKSKNLK